VDKTVDKLVGVCPLKLLPVLAVILEQENENGAQKDLNVWVVDVAATDTLQRDAICFELRGEEPRAKGTWAEPTAGSVYVEHATEYFCMEVIRPGTGV